MPDLPQPDHSEIADRPPVGPTATDPTTPETADAAPAARHPRPGRRRGDGRAVRDGGVPGETGLYDVARLWSKPGPPRPPPTDLPQFTVRDGEAHDYLTDLDAETLKRLAEVQGQLDGLGAQVTALRHGMQALASAAGQQRQQEAAHQAGCTGSWQPPARTSPPCTRRSATWTPGSSGRTTARPARSPAAAGRCPAGR